MKIAEDLTAAGVPFKYEGLVIPYSEPAKTHRYTPDFPLPNGVIVETKGRFVTADRQKHRLVKEQHPDLDIRFVFSNANAKLNKKSKTTYAMWCGKYGFKFSHRNIPIEWLKEKPLVKRMAAMKEFTKRG